jgi:hypothetical protein
MCEYRPRFYLHAGEMPVQSHAIFEEHHWNKLHRKSEKALMTIKVTACRGGPSAILNRASCPNQTSTTEAEQTCDLPNPKSITLISSGTKCLELGTML